MRRSEGRRARKAKAKVVEGRELQKDPVADPMCAMRREILASASKQRTFFKVLRPNRLLVFGLLDLLTQSVKFLAQRL
jgi:hypothetical protein